MRSPRILPVIGAAALALAACSGNTTPQADTTASSDDTQVPSRELVLNVYAAASLTETFEELESSYEAAYPDVDVRFTFAGSQDLVAQLSEGADVDVLATANESTMKKAADAGQVDAQTLFASNSLTLITTPGNPAGVTGLDSSLDGTDVRGKVSSGQADAGIVYKSDALAEGDAVETIDIAGADEAVNKYPIALVTASTKKDAGQKWIDLVLSPEGQALLGEAGFTPVNK